MKSNDIYTLTNVARRNGIVSQRCQNHVKHKWGLETLANYTRVKNVGINIGE